MLDYQKLIDHCVRKYGTEPEHLWAKWPEFTVLRHNENGKWYALLMNVPANKLGLEGTGTKWIVNVKCDPLLIQGLLQRRGFIPAYHMNKKNWISILLDGTVPDAEIESLIEESYQETI